MIRMNRALCVVALAWSLPVLGAQVTAKKDGVEVYADAAKSAKVLVTLKKGESLESADRKGMFWQVKTSNGKTGYVSVIAVNRSAETNGGLAKAIQAAAKEGRAGSEVSNARSRSAVMGVRGLDENEETSFAGNVKPNMRRVYAMEDRKPSEESIESIGRSVMKEIESRMDIQGD